MDKKKKKTFYELCEKIVLTFPLGKCLIGLNALTPVTDEE